MLARRRALLMAAAMAPLTARLSLALLAATMGMQGAAISRFGPDGVADRGGHRHHGPARRRVGRAVLPARRSPIAGAAWLDGAAWLAYVAGAAAASACAA